MIFCRSQLCPLPHTRDALSSSLSSSFFLSLVACCLLLSLSSSTLTLLFIIQHCCLSNLVNHFCFGLSFSLVTGRRGSSSEARVTGASRSVPTYLHFTSLHFLLFCTLNFLRICPGPPLFPLDSLNDLDPRNIIP